MEFLFALAIAHNSVVCTVQEFVLLHAVQHTKSLFYCTLCSIQRVCSTAPCAAYQEFVLLHIVLYTKSLFYYYYGACTRSILQSQLSVQDPAGPVIGPVYRACYRFDILQSLLSVRHSTEPVIGSTFYRASYRFEILQGQFSVYILQFSSVVAVVGYFLEQDQTD